MKTFTDFIVEASDYGPEAGSPGVSATGSWKTMSDADFEKYVKNLGPAGESLRRKRSQFKQTYNQAQQARTTQSQPKQGFGDRVRQAWDAAKQRRQQTPTSSTGLATKPKASGFRIPRPTRGQAAVGALNVGLGALDYKQRRDAGQTRVQAGSGAAASAAGGQAGWMTGAKLGAALPIPHPLGRAAATVTGGILGSVLGGSGASALSDKLTGVTPKAPTEQDYERARQKAGTTSARKVAAQAGVYGARSGSAIVGTGAKTQSKAQLPKTMLLPGGKVGDLAYKGGKPVYLARASVASRDVGLGGALRNISRTTGIGGQRERDAAAAKREYRTALASTQKYYKDIGVKDPAKVTLKSTGSLPARPLPGYGGAPKPAAKPAPKPAPAGGGMGGRRGSGSNPSVRK